MEAVHHVGRCELSPPPLQLNHIVRPRQSHFATLSPNGRPNQWRSRRRRRRRRRGSGHDSFVRKSCVGLSPLFLGRRRAATGVTGQPVGQRWESLRYFWAARRRRRHIPFLAHIGRRGRRRLRPVCCCCCRGGRGAQGFPGLIRDTVD